MKGVSKREFKILAIEDEQDSIGEQMDEINGFLEKFEFTLKQIPHEKNTGFLEKINHTIDLVIVDKNIEVKNDGIEIVKKIREKFKLLDILFYTANKLDKKEFEEITSYSLLEIVDGRKFVDRLQTLIEKYLSKWSDIIYLRGSVISRIIEIESEINTFLEDYFLSTHPKFRNFVLENKYVSLEAKKKIMSKIIEFEDVKFEGLGKLNKLQANRNLLAHCDRDPTNPNILKHMGSDEKFTKEKIYEIFDMINEFSTELDSLIKKIKEKKESNQS